VIIIIEKIIHRSTQNIFLFFSFFVCFAIAFLLFLPLLVNKSCIIYKKEEKIDQKTQETEYRKVKNTQTDNTGNKQRTQKS